MRHSGISRITCYSDNDPQRPPTLGRIADHALEVEFVQLFQSPLDFEARWKEQAMFPQILIASGAAVLGLLGTLHIVYTFFTNKLEPRECRSRRRYESDESGTHQAHELVERVDRV